MLDKAKKQKILCCLLLSAGIGLCIGGIFLPILLVFGVPLLSAGLAVAADIYDDKTRNTITNVYNYTAEAIPSVVEACVNVPKRNRSPMSIAKEAIGIMQERVRRKISANVENSRKNNTSNFEYCIENSENLDEQEALEAFNLSIDPDSKIMEFSLRHVNNVRNKPKVEKSKTQINLT